MTGRPRGMVVAEDDVAEGDVVLGREGRAGTVAAPDAAEALSDAPTEGEGHDVSEDAELEVETDGRDDVPSSIPADDASVPNAFDRLVSGTQAGPAGRRASARAVCLEPCAASRPSPATVPSKNDGDALRARASCASCARGSHRQPPPDDAVACAVCLEPCAISGPHQVASLACGHVFGHACISQWLERKKKKNGGKCPQCNARATTRDVRVLFVPSFHAFVDTDELETMKKVVLEQRAGRVDAETTATRVSRRLLKLEKDLVASEARAKALEDSARADAEALARAERRIGLLLKRKTTHDRDLPESSSGGDVNDDDDDRDGVAPLFKKTAGRARAESRERWRETDVATGGERLPTSRGALRDLLEPNPDGRARTRLGFGGLDDVNADVRFDERGDVTTRTAVSHARSERLRNGRFERRATARVSNARAFDVNGVVAAVGENGGGFGGDFLTKISLRSPDSARVRVALPAGSGLVRDVRLTNGGSSSLIDGSANGRALALAATLGKKLLVVDLDRDHVAARIDLPHAAWSCAWGGWATESHDSNATFVSLPGGEFRVAPRVALNSNGSHVDPCLDPNLCVVGGANGETLMYDLRATKNALARVAPPTQWRGSDARPVHTVIPLARHNGGGLLYGTCAGVRAFMPRSMNETENETENVFEDVFENVESSRVAPDADAAGVVVRVPGVDACGASLAFAPGARVVVATAREEPRGAGEAGGVVFAKHVVREWDRSRAWQTREGEGEGVVSNARHFVETTHSGKKKSVWSSTRPFPWWAGPDAMHARARVTCRAAITGPRHAALAGLIACGSLSVSRDDKGFREPASLRARRNVVALTDAVSGERFPDLEHAGAGHVEDVRGWCGDAPGSVEVLASLGADAMTVFSWDSSAC